VLLVGCVLIAHKLQQQRNESFATATSISVVDRAAVRNWIVSCSIVSEQ